MSKIFIMCFTVFVILVFACNDNHSTKKEVHIKTMENSKKLETAFRDYVLAECIVHAFKKDSIFNGDISPTVYNELTDYALAGPAGKKLDSLVKRNVESIKPSEIADYIGRKAIFVHCIDYYNSEELLKDVKKIIKESHLPVDF